MHGPDRKIGREKKETILITMSLNACFVLSRLSLFVAISKPLFARVPFHALQSTSEILFTRNKAHVLYIIVSSSKQQIMHLLYHLIYTTVGLCPSESRHKY